MFATIVMTLFLISFMFLVIMFIVYFDYILSIARLSSYLSISSYSAHSNDLSILCKCGAYTLFTCGYTYIPGHVVDRGCDTPIESFVVHSLNIGH
jgi:hypothetical protein